MSDISVLWFWRLKVKFLPMRDYYAIDDNPENSLRACAFYLAQDITEPKAQAEIVARIAAHYLATGELELAAQALEPLYDVSDSHEREQRFAELAALSAKHGEDDFAQQLAEACADETWQDTAHHDAALQQALRGDYAAARETAGLLGYPEPTLIEIARHAAEKDENEALSLADEVFEARSRAIILVEVAARRAAAGQRAEALELLDEAAQLLLDIDLPDEQVETLCALGVRYAAFGGQAQAAAQLQRAQAIAEAEADDRLLLRVAQSYLEAGDLERALYVAEEIDAFDISWLYADIAHAHARAGDFLAAQKLLDTLKDSHHKGRGCLLLARVYREQGDNGNARPQLERAFQLARDSRMQTSDDVKMRDDVLGAVAAEYLAAQDETTARQTADAMPESKERDEVWARIAAREAEDGRLRDALNTAANIAAPAARAQAQTALALRVAEFEARATKDWSLVRHALEGIPDFPLRLAARLEIARFLDEKDADEAAALRHTALQETQAQTRPALAATGLARLAVTAKTPSRFSDAVRKAAEINDLYQLTSTLLDLAEAQDELGCEPDADAKAALQQHLPV
jgi:hypothetical protein